MSSGPKLVSTVTPRICSRLPARAATAARITELTACTVRKRTPVSATCATARDTVSGMSYIFRSRKTCFPSPSSWRTDLHARGGIQFQADLVKVDARPDSGDHGAGGSGGLHVQRDDDGVVHGFRHHTNRIAFSGARQHAADPVAAAEFRGVALRQGDQQPSGGLRIVQQVFDFSRQVRAASPPRRRRTRDCSSVRRAPRRRARTPPRRAETAAGRPRFPASPRWPAPFRARGRASPKPVTSVQPWTS